MSPETRPGFGYDEGGVVGPAGGAEVVVAGGRDVVVVLVGGREVVVLVGGRVVVAGVVPAVGVAAAPVHVVPLRANTVGAGFCPLWRRRCGGEGPASLRPPARHGRDGQRRGGRS